jgi:2-dehydro-3-deoxy-D-arabinonate dehydratase
MSSNLNPPWAVCRYRIGDAIRIGLFSGNDVLDLTSAGIPCLEELLEAENPIRRLRAAIRKKPKRLKLSALQLCAPVERQEVWAAGVTYLRSKTARMQESDFSATAYDRVYEADRPELFFKSMPDKVVAPGESVGIRRDASWSVPEPELALVLNSRGKIVGYTIGNDMSSRDIEGENLLYLPQAKIYQRSCALGPWIIVGPKEKTVRNWKIRITIRRKGAAIFTGETGVSRIKRRFDELAKFLFRSQKFPHGGVLLTGTGVVPPDSFTLKKGDVVEIEVDGIGILRNPVTVV